MSRGLALVAAALVLALAPRAVAIGGARNANPVHGGDFPDPSVLRVAGGYVAYGTNIVGPDGVWLDVPMLFSPDLVHWQLMGDALPVPPRGAAPPFVWAPAVARMPGGWVMYVTADHRDANGHRQCIWTATAVAPIGPFAPASEPLLCEPGHSVLDAAAVFDGGVPYLVWKDEGPAGGLPAGIHARRLAADGRSFAPGAPRLLLLAQDGGPAWEGGLVEGPAMVPAPGGGWLLFYSANRWYTSSYAIGYARCRTVTGPCVRAPEPWLASAPGAWGPGGQSFVVDPAGGLWIAYHAWSRPAPGRPDVPSARAFHIGRVTLGQGPPVLDRRATDAGLLPPAAAPRVGGR